ncbi:S9 family peptidase [Spirosoma utsteinense]|uniref:Dipeptidyl aminopeptidase/acylaminoacyl peptidase n=1 Tax=Spirosoma utsteinense TaxID=2585773 RepID=A0ABR6W390_9BACT|nr:prolyl oligopeptidase family serine peptidase [Spirosoma utsteinense]MBC3786708.1 dipeptidyl aminopeptidase/acylaminoacyl peptidase [Spirosoma utsteinense]MBC3791071.1 dipeptidyl aminopeptidase/acylaminoacyl peptidase [Spirosoma utsteinense]
MARIAAFLVCFFINALLFAQSPKRPLTAADYDRWESVKSEKLSRDGRWIAYQVDPQEGNGRLEVADASQKTPGRVFPRGYMAQFTPDSRFLVMRLKVPVADTRKAKLKKKKAEDMPKDSVLVLNLTTGETTKLPNVKSFMFGKEAGSWLALLQDANTPKLLAEVTVSPRKDTLVPTQPTSITTVATRKGVTKKPKGDNLTLLNLADGTRRTVTFVSNVVMSDNGQTIVYSRESARDSLRPGDAVIPGVFLFNTVNGQTTLVDSSSTNKIYKGLAVDKAGRQLAWMTSADSAGADVRVFSLRYKNLAAPAPVKAKRGRPTPVEPPYRTLADTLTKALPNRWTVNEYREPKFSDDGRRLYFSTSPIAVKPAKDTLTPDDEKVRMDVWSWNDSRLQPMQQKRLKEEKERGFLTVVDLAPASTSFGRVALLANREVPTVAFDPKVNTRYLLGLSDLAYQVQSSWDPGHTDLYLIDTQSGEKKRIANDVMASDPKLSPGGQYAYWFDERDSLWRAWSVADGRRIDLTRGLPSKFFDEEHDTPSLPGSYGSAGWTTGDRYLWLYDRYDIWQIDPTGREKPANLTNGWGRTNRIRLRRADLDPDEKSIDPKTDLWLTGIWESDKHTGVLKATPPASGSVSISVMASSAHRYFGIGKARNAPTMTFYRGNFQEPINLFLTDTTFAKPTQLTKTNPQQDSIRWGSVELVKWVGTNGTPLEGLLFKPEGFDQNAGRKYPMLTYFYERNAETLNDYRFPAPSRSTINIPYCVSNGYLVFVPDIVYTTGQPGPNAYDCVVPGVLSLLDRPYVDRSRLGIQGQSWGGYQAAFIITRTNLFRAAMAGAAVANMTSAYGGIRWETGVVRQFQYEKTQSRIGGTLWDKPMNYLENSPLFYANRIQTPLMLMHNDADGAVPWQQGIEFFSGLRRLGKPVWMVVYNGEGHNLTGRHNAKDLSIRMYQFFDHYLKDAPMPVWMKDGRSAVEKDRGEMKY